jgi:hypothetical protein
MRKKLINLTVPSKKTLIRRIRINNITIFFIQNLRTNLNLTNVADRSFTGLCFKSHENPLFRILT